MRSSGISTVTKAAQHFPPSDRPAGFSGTTHTGKFAMSTLMATVVHSSISQHDSIEVSDDLRTAKRQAAREFGGGFIDHTIRIYDSETRETITERPVGGGRWSV